MKKPKATWRSKSLGEMSWDEMADYSESLSGLPFPRDGSVDDIIAYSVVSFIHQFQNEGKSREDAVRATIEFLLDAFERDDQLPTYRPHMEKALGRKLLEAEIADRKLYG